MPELHLADPRATKEYWCSSCKGKHKPTADHPICPSDSFPHLHAKFPTDLYIDFKGWRFRAPFHCMYCAIEVCPHQWAFSRSCGGCDVSNSHTARLSIFDGRIFSGPRELVDPKDSHFLAEERFLDPKDAEKFPVRNPLSPYPLGLQFGLGCPQFGCRCTCLHSVHPVGSHAPCCPEYVEEMGDI